MHPTMYKKVTPTTENTTHLIHLGTVSDTIGSASKEQCSFCLVDMNLFKNCVCYLEEGKSSHIDYEIVSTTRDWTPKVNTT